MLLADDTIKRYMYLSIVIITTTASAAASLLSQLDFVAQYEYCSRAHDNGSDIIDIDECICCYRCTYRQLINYWYDATLVRARFTGSVL